MARIQATAQAQSTQMSRPLASRGVFARNDQIVAAASHIDEARLNRGRLERLRTVIKSYDCAGVLLADPMNIRYATGTRNMAIWTLHSPGRYVFVPTEGPVVMFEFATSMHLDRGNPLIDELRPSTSFFYFMAGSRSGEKAQAWAAEIFDLVQTYGGGNRRLGVDRCDPLGAFALQQLGLSLFDAQEPLELARAIKSPDELAAMAVSMAVCDLGCEAMRQNLRPGITENQLWAILHDANIAHNGEWIECRLLASGPRTNPWFQECSDRVIQAGDVVGFDTDMVGPFGYLSDISRSYICPDEGYGSPAASDEIRHYTQLAQEQVLFNAELIRPGMGFREFAKKSWQVPEEFLANRYMSMVHGVGLVDEYPSIACAMDFADWGYDGVFEANMVVSVESYIGRVGGGCGIKMEQQVLITETGAIPMSNLPFADSLMIV
ncbi:MAG: Xaa-Pro peptidase family protein [Alphaproteobacteria bacterium]|nr:Xaa-Pro peptidase family protein [Alphaproteobacteria bacterium]